MSKHQNPATLVLASASPYRKELLGRLQLRFVCHSPVVDESPLTGEPVKSLVERLAILKARAAATHYPAAIIIGSDQAAVLNNEILNKPGSHDQARDQLRKLSGQEIVFNTGLCVLNTGSGGVQSACISCAVRFRTLTAPEIERYLTREQPYDCAGSFKSEGLGISLLESLHGDDPTALIGLPLIRLSQMLRNEGFDLP